jgi:hypothetical protein
MNFFFKCFSIITDGITDGNSVGKSIGKSVGNSVGKSLGNSVGNKKIITDVYVPSVNPSVILLPTDSPTDKTLPTNDSPTDHFRL